MTKTIRSPSRRSAAEEVDILESTEVLNEDAGAPYRRLERSGKAWRRTAARRTSRPSATTTPPPHRGSVPAAAHLLSAYRFGGDLGAAAAAFAELGALSSRRNSREGEPELRGGDSMLEDIVREPLRPLRRCGAERVISAPRSSAAATGRFARAGSRPGRAAPNRKRRTAAAEFSPTASSDRRGCLENLPAAAVEVCERVLAGLVCLLLRTGQCCAARRS